MQLWESGGSVEQGDLCDTKVTQQSQEKGENKWKNEFLPESGLLFAQ